MSKKVKPVESIEDNSIAVVGVFRKERECKHSVRYKPTDEESACLATIIYVMNEALEVLNQPDEIKVTFEVF